MKSLSVYIDKDKHDIYEKLVKRGVDNPDHYPFQTMKDLFMVAACLGAKEGAYEPISSSRDIFKADIFNDKIDVPVMAALAYHKTGDLSILLDDKEVLNIAQAFANGGITYVVEEVINNPGTPLNNFVNLIESV